MFEVYILQSFVDKSYYIGHAEDAFKRLVPHNKGRVRSTKSKRPWKIMYREAMVTKREAYKRELQIKSYKGGNAFKKLVHGQVAEWSIAPDCKSGALVAT